MVVRDTATLDTSVLSNLTEVDLYAQSGGDAGSLPAVTSYSGVNFASDTFETDNAGSVLDLTHLTTLTGATNFNILYINANGGTVKLGNVTTDGGGTIRATANGGTIDFSQLPKFFSNSNYDSQLVSENGGHILTPVLTTISDVELVVRDTATIDTSVLSNLTEVDLYAQSGGTLAMPALTSYSGVNFASDTFETDNAGSVLDLTHLTTLTGATNFNLLYINANGGTVKLGNVTTDGGGTIRATANGGTVDLSKLSRFFSDSQYDSELTAENGGQVLTPSLTTLDFVTLTAHDTGAITTSALTDIDGASLYAEGGDTLAFPSLTSYSGTNSNSSTFETDNAGSVLDLSHLTTLTGFATNFNILYVNANSGGAVNLSGVTSNPGNSIRFTANGANSSINLTQLPSLNGTGQYTSQLVATNSGQISLTQGTLSVTHTDLSVTSGGVLTAGTIRDYPDGTLSGDSTIQANVITSTA